MADANKYHDLIKSGECLVPGFTSCDPLDQKAHIARYTWAKQFCRGLRVLDAACGCGYGTEILAEVAKHVHGIDLKGDAIQYAWDHYAKPNNGFEERSVYAIARLPQFDRIVSFETIEHVRNPARFVRQAHKALVEDGLFIVSSPEGSDSCWHFWNFTKQQLSTVLAQEFDMSQARYFRQNFGETITENGKFDCFLPTHIFVCRK